VSRTLNAATAHQAHDTLESHEAVTARIAVVLEGALGIWLGIQALRSFMLVTVWNTPGEDAPASLMGLVALAVYSIGLAAWLPARLVGGPRPALRFAILFGAIVLARQAVGGHVPNLVLSWASCVAWLWWLPAFLADLEREHGLQELVPATLLGLALLAAGQAALHGLDVPLLVGGAGLAVGALQVAAFLVVSAWRSRQSLGETVSPPGGNSLGLVAWGAFVFVELVLLSNLGRVEVLTGLGPLAASALILAGLVLATLSLAWPGSHWRRLALGVLAVVIAIPDLLPQMLMVPGLVVAQLGLTHALAGALVRGGGPMSRGRLYATTVGAALLLFALLFGYYAPYGWHPLWAVGAALVVLAAMPSRLSRVHTGLDARWAAAPLAIGLVGLAAAFIPSGGPPAATGPAPAQLKVVSYNVFQGLCGDSVPCMPAIADFIEAQDPDVVSMYEVNRGWNISGAIEMVAYLQWRFPGYQVISLPTGDELYVNTIMSRYPIGQWGTGLHPPGKGLRRGYGWATIPDQAGDVLYITSHLSNLSEDDRTTETAELLKLWQQRPRTVVAGDFNAQPDEQAVRQLIAGGLKDVQAAHGLERAPTFSSLDPQERIDYVLASPDVQSLSAQIGTVHTSDHLPVIVNLQFTSGTQ
jgi:endonuclease/exonuclease/phosphatase family metal-dependent hydrolase